MLELERPVRVLDGFCLRIAELGWREGRGRVQDDLLSAAWHIRAAAKKLKKARRRLKREEKA